MVDWKRDGNVRTDEKTWKRDGNVRTDEKT